MMETEVTVPNEAMNQLSPHAHRRGSFFKLQSHSLDDKDDFTSSLPLALTAKDLDDLKIRESSSKTLQNGFSAQRRGSGGLLSPLSPTSLGASRPRSASLCSSRKSFLGIPKNRPSSVKLLHRTGKQGADSAKESSTFAIDTALAKIRNQLEQLSLEDQVMEERVNRLTSEIGQLMTLQQSGRTCHSAPSLLLQAPPEPYRCYKRTQSDEPLRHKLLLHNFDGHQCNAVLSDLKETCEELSLEKGAEEEVDCVPSFDLVCKEFEESPCKRGSLDSTESVESVSESPVGEVCVVIVTDTSEQSSQGTTGTSQMSGSSQTEDDVFFSQ